MPTTLFELTASCAFGLEAVVKRELSALQIESTIQGNGRVHFRGDQETIFRTNLWLATADRILIRIAEFDAADFDALFDQTKAIAWADVLPVDASIPVTGRSAKSGLTSVPACQRTVKRAIVDAMMRGHGTESLPESGAVYKVDVSLLNDVATLTIDTTGRSLHRRGYRVAVSQAPLKETLAASLIQLSFWKPGKPFLDPFCGSGTLPIEAARMARNIAPGLNREFACESWQDFSPDLIGDLRSTAVGQQVEPSGERLVASDIDSRVLKLARDNAARAGVADDIHFEVKEAKEITSRRRFGCLITNPPYGRRLRGENHEVEEQDRSLTKQEQRRQAITWELDEMYTSMTEALRKLPTWSHFFLTAYPGFEKLVGRPADRRRKLYNGRIECTYFQFHGPKAVVEHRGEGAAEPTDKPDGGDTKTHPVTQADSSETSASSTDSSGPAESEKHDSKKRDPAGQTLIHASGSAAFGALSEKAEVQAETFAARLRKRAKHLRRWPTKRDITCFRLYERDVAEVPFVIDRYDDSLHITEYERPHDRDPAQHTNWLELMVKTASKTLEVPMDKVHFKSRQRQRGKTQYVKQDDRMVRKIVTEGGLSFLVNLVDYVDTGLFLDHRVARQMVRKRCEGKAFLNLFAYTGAFSVYAAAGGARKTTTVDLSKNYLDWAQENMRLNKFTGDAHRYIRQDVVKFIDDHAPGEMYDVVVCDPPTFSNSKKTEVDWDVQKDALPLLKKILPLVNKGGRIYFSTNFRRFKFDESEFDVTHIHEISKQTVPEDFRNRRIHRCWLIQK